MIFDQTHCIFHEKLWINLTQKKHIGRMITIDFKSVFPPKANSLDQDNRTPRKGSGWGFPRLRCATTWRELISLSNFCHSFSTRTVRTIRTGRVDTEEAFGRRAVKWIGPALLLSFSKGISIFQLSYPMTQRIRWLQLVNLVISSSILLESVLFFP